VQISLDKETIYPDTDSTGHWSNRLGPLINFHRIAAWSRRSLYEPGSQSPKIEGAFTAKRAGDFNTSFSRFHRTSTTLWIADPRTAETIPAMRIVSGRQACGRDNVFGVGQRAAIFRQLLGKLEHDLETLRTR
jgi:hypothetical protein